MKKECVGTIKAFACAAVLAMAGAASADSLYTFVTDKDGYSWIQINHDMDSFSFKLTNTGLDKYNAGDLRYFTFTGDKSPAEDAWKKVGGINYGDKVKEGYISYGIIDKMNETVTLKDLKAGTRIGFQMVDAIEYHNEFNWNFQGLESTEGTVWFGSYAAGKDDKGILDPFKGFFTYGAHHNDWVTLGSFYVNGYCAACFNNDWETYVKMYGDEPGGGNDTPLSGAPLPGALAMLLFGGAGAGFLKLRRRQAK